MSFCTWIDPYDADPRAVLRGVPESGMAAALGFHLAGREERGAVMVCPGGAYGALAEVEALPVARFLASHGIHAFVLRYRHAPHFFHPASLEDARRALRIIRHGAQQGWWPVEMRHVAVMGFGAGGHLAALLATDGVEADERHSDAVERQSSRPDAQVLAYPVIQISKAGEDEAILRNLLGPEGALELAGAVAGSLDADQRVTATTPPAFLFHTASDAVVPVGHSLAYALALVKNKVAVDLHCFQPGRHGLGLASENVDLQGWPDLLASWLKRLGF
ncbi:MAG TPA: alpha/beta hydrolase [Tepidisphaeraceae bacterium]|nr:alpha/beta hydrolase [Tepidisphaeraceae bacterium]